MIRPGPTSTKNLLMPGMAAAGDLGLGDQLQSQVEDEVNLRKKKLLKNQQELDARYGAAALDLFAGRSY